MGSVCDVMDGEIKQEEVRCPAPENKLTCVQTAPRSVHKHKHTQTHTHMQRNKHRNTQTKPRIVTLRCRQKKKKNSPKFDVYILILYEII